MARDLDTFVSRLNSIQPRLDVSEPELLEQFWQAHPRFQFFKALPWGSNLLDIGAGNGGLAHWKGWGKLPRPDLNLYGIDLERGEFCDRYAGWEAINLDEELPQFSGVTLNAFYASHLIEHLASPERLVEWIGGRAEAGAKVYIEWPDPKSVDLPTREQLREFDIEVVLSNFMDDGTHRKSPDLATLSGWLREAGFAVISSGTIDLAILGEELFARAIDADTRTMGYWSMTGFSLYAVAIKSTAAVRATPGPAQ